MYNGVIAWYTDGKKEIKGVSFEGEASAMILGELICLGIKEEGFGPYIENFKCESIVHQNRFFKSFNPNRTSIVYVIDSKDRKVELWINERKDKRYQAVYPQHSHWIDEWRFHKIYEFDFIHVDNNNWFDFESVDDYIEALKDGSMGYVNDKLTKFTLLK